MNLISRRAKEIFAPGINTSQNTFNSHATSGPKTFLAAWILDANVTLEFDICPKPFTLISALNPSIDM